MASLVRRFNASLGLVRYFVIAAIGWTLLHVGCMAWIVSELKKESLRLATVQAQVSSDKDIAYRNWILMHGGVYVPVTDTTHPSPFLAAVPERDVVTPSGRVLTLRNSALIMRQVHELGGQESGLSARIAAMGAVQPQNEADPWERAALETLNRGASEVLALEGSGDSEVLRLIRPIWIEKNCNGCHFKEETGQKRVQGGVSISVPMAPFRTVEHKNIASMAGTSLLLWAAGMGFLFFVCLRLRCNERERVHFIEAMHESDRRFREMLENISLVAVMLDKSGRITFGNDYLLALTGWTREEIIGQNWFEMLLPEEVRETVKQLFLTNLHTGNFPAHYQNEILTKSGERRLIAWNNTVLRDPCGSMIGGTSIGEDITQRTHAERELKESEERLRIFVEHAPASLAMLDRNMRYLCVSRKWLNQYSPGEHDVTGRSHYEVFPETSEDWKAIHGRALAGEVVRSENDRVERLDGSVQWLRWEVRPWYDAAGSVGGIVIFTEDITEIKLAEDALRESRERYAAIFDQSPIAIELFDSEGELVMANLACYEMFGVADKEGIPGFKLFDDPNVDESVRFRLLNGETVKSDGEYDYEKVESLGLYRTTNSGIRFFDRIITPIRNGDTGSGYIVQVQDVTERRQAESERKKLESQLRQAQKMEAIGTLAGGIAHDFNNILSAVIGYSDLALTEITKDSFLSYYVEQIQKSGYRAKDLVRQILAFSRQCENEKCPVEMGLLVKEVVKLLRASIPSTVEIRAALTARSDCVLADATQMHQVLMNLCTNAWQAMRERTGLIEVSLRETCIEDGRSPYLELKVRDTGCGIPPETIERIFDPYFTTKPRGEGTGLGLAVVQGIVKAHGGVVRVESTPGAGATFRVLLPLLQSEPLASPTEGATLPRGKGHILYIDDEPALVEIGKAILGRLGYKVTGRVSSLEALEAFRAESDVFDLVITDYAMPRMSGIELAREVLAIRTQVPIIMCTGFSEEIPPEKARLYGISEVLMKPIITSELADAVHRLLGGNTDAAT